MHLLKTIWILLLVLYFNLHANILIIPTDFNTIQDGINAANIGDTVLVQPGIYFENISFLGKNITVASRYLTTLDTSFITQTVIDGNQFDSVVRFENMENSDARLTGFTITNGLNTLGGGGIFCFAFSNPTLDHLLITENAGSGGGGIICFGYASPVMNNLTIKNNEAALFGGGLHCEFLSSPILNNVLISNNTSYQDGGGAYFLDSSFATLNNTIIKNNYAERNGGGIGCENESSIISNNTEIFKNIALFGGGLFIKNTNLTITQNRIFGNFANEGGGIYSSDCKQANFVNSIIEKNRSIEHGGGFCLVNSTINFDNLTIRNNIAHNSGGGVYCDSSIISFSSTNRSNIYLNFSGRAGNDLINNGPKAIHVILDTFTVKNIPAKYQVYPTSNFIFDILHDKVQRTSANLYVDPAGNDKNNGLTKKFPLKTLALALTKALPDSQDSQTIFVGGGRYSESTSGEYFPLNLIDNITIQGDSDSVAVFDAENLSSVFMLDKDQNVFIKNLVFTGGSSEKGGAIYCNDADPYFERVTMYGNYADFGGGIYSENNSTPFIMNSTISGNFTTNGGGIYISNNHVSLVNSILWNNFPQEIYFDNLADSGKITTAYSNIKGGKNNIISNRTSMIYWLEGNIDTDPLFVDTSQSNYALQDTSMCINHGMNDSLIVYDNGNKVLKIPPMSFSGFAPDMGAWEFIDILNYQSFENGNYPNEFSLFQNYPNPFNPRTRIDFIIPDATNISIKIYNSIGKLVKILVNKKMRAGKNSIYFDGSKFSSGQYYYQIISDKFRSTKRMLLLK